MTEFNIYDIIVIVLISYQNYVKENLMKENSKKFKKMIGVGLLSILFTGVGFASANLNWGGEEDVVKTHEVLTQLDKKLESTKLELNNVNSDKENLENNITDLQQKIAEATRKLEEAQIKYHESVIQNSNLVSQIDTINNEKNQLTSELVILQDELNKKSEIESNLRESLKSYEELMIQYQDRINELQDDNDQRLLKALQEVKELREYAEQLEQKHLEE